MGRCFLLVVCLFSGLVIFETLIDHFLLSKNIETKKKMHPVKKILLFAVGCYFLLNMASVVLGDHLAYKNVKEEGTLVGRIESMCINCESEKEYYSLVLDECSNSVFKEANIILIGKREKNKIEEIEFVQEEVLVVSYDAYKMTHDGKEIVIEIPVEISTVE